MPFFLIENADLSRQICLGSYEKSSCVRMPSQQKTPAPCGDWRFGLRKGWFSSLLDQALEQATHF